MNNSNVLLTSCYFNGYNGGIERSLISLIQNNPNTNFSLVFSKKDFVSSDNTFENASFYLFSDLDFKYFNVFFQIFNCSILLLKLKFKGFKFDYLISRDYRTTIAIKLIFPYSNLFYLPGGMAFTEIDHLRKKYFFQNIYLSIIFHLEKIALNCSTKVFVFSNFFGNQLKLNFKFCRHKVIFPLIDTKKFAYKPCNNFKNRQLGSLNLLSVGRLEPVKNYSEQLNLLSHLKFSEINIFLNILGDGSSKSKILEEIDKFNISSNIRITSSSDSNIFFNCSDAFLFTSNFETFGQVLIEAYLNGLPILYPLSNFQLYPALEFIDPIQLFPYKDFNHFLDIINSDKFQDTIKNRSFLSKNAVKKISGFKTFESEINNFKIVKI